MRRFPAVAPPAALVLLAALVLAGTGGPAAGEGDPPGPGRSDKPAETGPGAWGRPDWFIVDPKSGQVVVIGPRGAGGKVSKEDLKLIGEIEDDITVTLKTVHVDESGFRFLAESPHVRSLTFNRCDLTDEGVRLLVASESLIGLQLVEVYVTDDTLGHIGRMKSLKRLYLQECPLLSYTGVLKLKRERRDLKVEEL